MKKKFFHYFKVIKIDFGIESCREEKRFSFLTDFFLQQDFLNKSFVNSVEKLYFNYVENDRPYLLLEHEKNRKNFIKKSF